MERRVLIGGRTRGQQKSDDRQLTQREKRNTIF